MSSFRNLPVYSRSQNHMNPQSQPSPAEETEGKPEQTGDPWALPVEKLEKPLKPQLLDRVEPITAESASDVVLVGPPASGKSSFLGSLARASTDAQEGASISLRPGFALTALAGEYAKNWGQMPPCLAATPEPSLYDFQVEVCGASIGVPVERAVTVQEWPGSLLFRVPGCSPPSRRDCGMLRFFRAARQSTCLVLCVDSSVPARHLWGDSLPQLLEGLTVSTGRLLPGLSLPTAELPPTLSPQRQLPFSRVLVLLTKIDRLCAEAVEHLRAKGYPPFVAEALPFSRLARSPLDLARNLDPLGLAENLLGVGLLDTIRSALPRQADLAVGLASSWGFGRTSPSGRNQDLSTWSPWGFGAALLFLLTGQALQPVAEFLPRVSSSAAIERWACLYPSEPRNIQPF